MEMVRLNGQMVSHIKEIINKIKKIVMVYLYSLMVENIWENGKMTDKMEEVSII